VDLIRACFRVVPLLDLDMDSGIQAENQTGVFSIEHKEPTCEKNLAWRRYGHSV